MPCLPGILGFILQAVTEHGEWVMAVQILQALWIFSLTSHLNIFPLGSMDYRLFSLVVNVVARVTLKTLTRRWDQSRVLLSYFRMQT